MNVSRQNQFLPRTVRDELVKQITSAQYQPGDPLPSERKLAEQFAVSRPTVREALSILEKEGYIVRRVGVGTFVSQRPVVNAGLETLSSFTEMMAAQGYHAGTRDLHIVESAMTDEEIVLFEAESGAIQMRVERVRTLDDQPVMFSIHLVPKAILGDLSLEHYQRSFFTLLEAYSGTTISHANAQIYSIAAGEEIGKKLGLASDFPLLVTDELIYGANGQLLCRAIAYFRADFHRYHLIRRRSGH